MRLRTPVSALLAARLLKPESRRGKSEATAMIAGAHGNRQMTDRRQNCTERRRRACGLRRRRALARGAAQLDVRLRGHPAPASSTSNTRQLSSCVGGSASDMLLFIIISAAGARSSRAYGAPTPGVQGTLKSQLQLQTQVNRATLRTVRRPRAPQPAESRRAGSSRTRWPRTRDGTTAPQNAAAGGRAPKLGAHKPGRSAQNGAGGPRRPSRAHATRRSGASGASPRRRTTRWP